MQLSTKTFCCCWCTNTRPRDSLYGRTKENRGTRTASTVKRTDRLAVDLKIVLGLGSVDVQPSLHRRRRCRRRRRRTRKDFSGNVVRVTKFVGRTINLILFTFLPPRRASN